MSEIAKLKENHPELSLRAFARLVDVAYWKLRDFIKQEKAGKYRLQKKAKLKAQINEIALRHPTYGYSNIYFELRDQGIKVGLHKVRRILKELGLNPPKAKRRRAKPKVTPVMNWPEGRRIQSDATNVKLAQGSAWVYIVQDVPSRACLAIKVVEALSMHKAKQTLEEAICCLRKQGITKNIVIQSDSGSDFTSNIFQVTCAKFGQWIRSKVNQKGSYSELFTIVLVGELLQQKNQGLWYSIVKSDYESLFPDLPELSRFYRSQRNFERIYADFALLIAQHDGVYLIDSKPIPICKGIRHKRERPMIEAVSGRGGVSKFFCGFKLHSITNPSGYFCRFAITEANLHDVSVAKVLLNKRHDDFSSIIGDKAYIGLGIYTPPKANAKEPQFWSSFFNKARQSIEATFSSLVRSKNLALQQLNSFWRVRASICRKIAANLQLFLFNLHSRLLEVEVN